MPGRKRSLAKSFGARDSLRNFEGGRIMPGAHLLNPYRGNSSEYIAQVVLNAIAFAAYTPRQEDVGHDFVCYLSEVRGSMLWAGPSFTVQVKSNRDPLVYDKEHELAWLDGLENPFFLVVVTREEMRVDFYSTWKRLVGLLSRGARRRLLIPGLHDAAYEGVQTEDDESEQQIPLDKPIVTVTAREIMEQACADRVRAVLRTWIELDRNNIVNRSAGFYWTLGIREWTTNEPIRPDVEWFFSHPQNLEVCARNFGRSATALRAIYRRVWGETGENVEPAATRIRDLNQVLRSHRHLLSGLAKKSLKDWVGFDPDGAA
jgi:hypothetical protein